MALIKFFTMKRDEAKKEDRARCRGVGAEDGSSGGRVGLVSLCGSGFVSFGESGLMSFCRFAFARCRIGGGNRRRLSGRVLRRSEEEVGEKTAWGKGREECFAGDKMRRTCGLTRT